MKILSKLILFLSLLSLVSCTITKRKYTGGFYVNWHGKAPETRVIPQAQRTREALLRGHVMGKLCLPDDNISTTYPNVSLWDKTISPRSTASRVCNERVIANNVPVSPSPIITTRVNKSGSEGMPPHTDAARFRNNGLLGFELALLDLIVLGLLIFFGHIGYTVFVLGCLLLIIGLTITGLIYSFMGLNANDKHRVLGLLGVLLCVFVIIGLIYYGL